MTTRGDVVAAARRVLKAQASGTIPSFVDHVILGTLEDLEQAQEEKATDPFAVDEAMESEPGDDVEDGDIIDAAVEPVTSRPQPAPEPPPAPAPVVQVVEEPPVAPVPDLAATPAGQVMATRVALMNPGMKPEQVRALVREAMQYLV